MVQYITPIDPSNIRNPRDFDDTLLKPVNNDGNDTYQEQEQTDPESADG